MARKRQMYKQPLDGFDRKSGTWSLSARVQYLDKVYKAKFLLQQLSFKLTTPIYDKDENGEKYQVDPYTLLKEVYKVGGLKDVFKLIDRINTKIDEDQEQLKKSAEIST